jgi:CRISPR system Cascade subunit CasE
VFLSRLHPDLRNQVFRRDYADVHDLHRTLMSAFPRVEGNVPARQALGLLWRMDEDRQGFVLYVQSAIKPDWTCLPPGYLLAPARIRPLQPLLDQLVPGRKLAFRLVANPTRSAIVGPDHQPMNGRRIIHRDPDEQLEWLNRKGEQHGFTLPTTISGAPDVLPSPRPRLTGRTNRPAKGSSRITIDPIRFDGHLIITESNAFTEALQHGIGRAKAYGCGLLSLAPPHHPQLEEKVIQNQRSWS